MSGEPKTRVSYFKQVFRSDFNSRGWRICCSVWATVLTLLFFVGKWFFKNLDAQNFTAFFGHAPTNMILVTLAIGFCASAILSSGSDLRKYQRLGLQSAENEIGSAPSDIESALGGDSISAAGQDETDMNAPEKSKTAEAANETLGAGTAWKIIAAHLFSSWLISIVFTLVSVPFYLYLIIPKPADSLLLGLALAATIFMQFWVCAIGVGWSSLISRKAKPVETAAYLGLTLVILIGLGSLITFAYSLVLGICVATWVIGLVATKFTAQKAALALGVIVTVIFPISFMLLLKQNPNSENTYTRTETGCVKDRTGASTKFTWWLIAVNPVVALADSLPYDKNFEVPIGFVGYAAKMARYQPMTEQQCLARADEKPVWPFGYALIILTGAAGIFVAQSRIRKPLPANENKDDATEKPDDNPALLIDEPNHTKFRI